MKKSKFAAFIILVSAALVLFAGCADKSVFDEVISKKTIVWGTNAEFEPFESKDSSGEVIGVDAEIAAAIAKELGVALEVEDMEFDSLPAALKSSQIDFIAAGYTSNEERALSMDFSKPYFTAAQVVIVRADDESISTKDDLSGKSLGVQTGTTGDTAVASLVEGAQVSRYNSILLAAEDLALGKIDAVIADNLPAMIIVKRMDGLNIVESISYEEEKYAIAVKKGETELLDKINGVIDELLADGKIDGFVEKYFSMG
ncbi:MAG: Cystine-binding periplasmic protein precursor [Firmicutes bacterium ADurb.Bin182]|nr:MAG: Cystine-binding periplasmic protein precursor [Firmicutes bacterium ADurb.Bin182]